MFRFQWAEILSIFAKNNYDDEMSNIGEMFIPMLTEIKFWINFCLKRITLVRVATVNVLEIQAFVSIWIYSIQKFIKCMTWTNQIMFAPLKKFIKQKLKLFCLNLCFWFRICEAVVLSYNHWGPQVSFLPWRVVTA